MVGLGWGWGWGWGMGMGWVGGWVGGHWTLVDNSVSNGMPGLLFCHCSHTFPNFGGLGYPGFPNSQFPKLWALHCYTLTLMSQMLCQCYCFPNLQACPQWQNAAGFPNFHFHRILTLQAICPSIQPQNQPKIASTDSCGDFSPEPSSPP